MGFAILRIQKLKSGHALRRSFKHAFREQDTPNADPERLQDNTHYGATNTREALARFNARLPEKVRKNAVLAVEFLMTASPEDMRGKTRQQQDAYFADALQWLQQRHGAENVVYAGIHRDETTPHLYAYVVPIDPKGKLNCRHFLGAADALSTMQSDFAQAVGNKHELERGLKGSKALHVPIQQYYARVNAAFKPFPKVTTPQVKDRPEPEKPLWPFGDALEEWRKDHDKWEREQAQRAKRAKEIQAQQRVAVERAREYEAKASEAAALDKEAKRLNKLAAKATTERDQITAQAAQLAAELDLFTPAERERAKQRRAEQKREQARQAEQERQAEQQRQQRAKVDQERERRVNQLAHLVKTAGGALATFANKAKAAINAMGGNWRGVDWRGVEQDSLREAITRNKQEPRQAIADVLRHSPAAVAPEEVESRFAELQATVGRLRPSHGPRHGRDYDSGPTPG